MRILPSCVYSQLYPISVAVLIFHSSYIKTASQITMVLHIINCNAVFQYNVGLLLKNVSISLPPAPETVDVVCFVFSFLIRYGFALGFVRSFCCSAHIQFVISYLTCKTIAYQHMTPHEAT